MKLAKSLDRLGTESAFSILAEAKNGLRGAKIRFKTVPEALGSPTA